MVSLYKAKAKPSRLGQQIKLQIDNLDYEANGISRYQQKIAFVSGALPGEQVLASVTEDKADYLKARTVKVLQQSAERVEPFCPSFTRCGGCQLQYLSAEQQRLYKQQGVQALLCHQLGLQTLPWQPMLSAADRHYRRKARIGLWYDKKQRQLTVGFRQGGSKQLAEVTHCDVLATPLQPIFATLKQVVPRLSRPESVTHAEVILADEQPVVVIRHVAALTAAEQQAFVSVWPDASWYGEAEPGKFTSWQYADQPLRYTLAEQGINLEFAADDFIQVNTDVNQLLVSQAVAWLAPTAEDTILDLYAGMGNFSLALAKSAKLVHGVEGLSKMVQQATENAQLNQLQNVHFWQADLHLPWGKTAWNQPIYQKVLLDPARAGAEGAVKQLLVLKPAQILYVSCNPATFARDAKVLLAAGYQLQKLAGVDMFPHTAHLELMALFSRQ
ncbi:MAG: 23S rRNA (uracil(1939)-C(5))-methyltransferase [Alishewanella sp. 34-51-39]|nr:MAG: 23S rRNA (uracil(1939)-C(5))-methyltransferase [Alishewanella sp. 34-51-39]